jgi:hypothetical protein
MTGTLELVVTTAKTSVRAEVQARSRGLYDVTFVPQEILPHFINITFNEEHINNSPFEVDVQNTVEAEAYSNGSGLVGAGGDMSNGGGNSIGIVLPLPLALKKL